MNLVYSIHVKSNNASIFHGLIGIFHVATARSWQCFEYPKPSVQVESGFSLVEATKKETGRHKSGCNYFAWASSKDLERLGNMLTPLL
mmetsp:Transcript_9325/g.10842  ORF Transcript_9325/g.10842 Transcript_9325/m.10842 type:complete len:88 (+) Transcript_9325:1110-1373(+)